MNRLNISVDLFGRSGWKWIHYVASLYPISEPKKLSDPLPEYKEFFDSLEYVLSCLGCRDHFSQLYQEKMKSPEHFANKEALLRLTYDLHDAVNVRIGKKSPTYDEFLAELNGPSGTPNWLFIHAVTFGYPETFDTEISPHFINFFQALQKIALPNLKLTNTDFITRDFLIQKVFEIHKGESRQSEGLPRFDPSWTAFTKFFNRYIVS